MRLVGGVAQIPRSLTLIALVAAGAMPLPSSAQSTIGSTLQAACPDAYSMQVRASRSYDLAQSDFQDLSKQAATLYYDCYQQLKDPHTRDLAHLSYLEALGFSAQENDSGLQAISVAIAGTKDLATATKFDDVREFALKLLKVSEGREQDILKCIAAGGC
jgi:hypothetical protein